MASNSVYRILLEAQIDPNSINSQIKTISAKNTLMLNIKFNQGDMNKLNSQLDKIKATGAELSKITIFSGKNGKIGSAAIEYLDANKNIVKTTLEINRGLATTHSTMQNLGKDAREFSKALLDADKFLEKSKQMAQTPTVRAAVSTAEQIKVAVSQGDIEKVRLLNAELAIQKSAMSGIRSGLDSWAQGMGNAIKQTVEYSLSIGLVYGALNQIKQGIQYIKDLNKELTNIQLVTGGTAEETAQLAVGYNDLAKEMSGTTIEVAKGSLEYVRQGKNAEETGILIRDTMMLAKLGNMETADATERLTAIMNGFKLEAEEVNGVVDKLVQLDNKYATSVDEISTAMRYSSNSAQQAGVDFDHLAAYITVVSSTTRGSAETIGQSFKTMFARFTDIKAGKIDEDGLGINNVEAALQRVGIALRDDKKNFRDIQDVIEELGSKWEEIGRTQGETEQANIAKMVAGVRQKEQFLVLMNNQLKVGDALAFQDEASGLAKERYAIYMESIEASQNRLTASWEEMVSGTATKDMITGFYEMARGAIEFVNAIGGIPTILKIALPLLIGFSHEWLLLKAGNIVGMIGSMVTGIQGLAVSFGLATPAIATAEAGMVGFSAATAVASLGISLLVGALILAISKTKELHDEQMKKIETQQNTNADIAKESSSYDEYIQKSKEAAKASGYFYDESGKAFTKGYHDAKIYVNGLDLMSEAMYKNMGIMKDADRGSDSTYDSLTKVNEVLKDGTFYTGEASTAYSGLASTMKNLTDSAASVEDIIGKQLESGGIDFADVANIPPEYMDALKVEGDQLTINIGLIKEKQLASAEMSLRAIEEAYAREEATEQELEVVNLYYNSLLEQSQATFGQFNQTAWDYDALLWQIANDAVNAGYTFEDMSGKALSSAQEIYAYMSQGDATFNDFIRQAANATGVSVAQAMNTVSGMVAQTYNNTMAMIQSLGNSMAGIYAMQGFMASGGANYTPAPVANLFSTPATPVRTGGGGGGGGGQSKEDKKASDKAKREAEAQKREQAIQKEIDKARKGATDGLKDQLKAYKDILDVKKDILDATVSENKYNQDIAAQNKNILNIQNELAALQNDNSAEAQARRLQLEDDLAKAQQDLANSQLEHSVDSQKAALDADYAAFEDRINNAIKAVEAIEATSVEDFASQLASVLSKPADKGKKAGAGTGASGARPIPTFHNGGMVGSSMTLKSNETFAKLLTDELVVNSGQMDRFIKSTLPAIAQSTGNGSGGVEINMPINVAGNLDKSVIPDLERITNSVVKKINEAMLNRGYTRRADSYGI